MHSSKVRRSFAAFALAVAALVTGCAGPSPNYAPSIDNVEAFKKSGAKPTNVGTFTVVAGAPGASAIGLRGASMVSSVGANYGDYVAAALRQELELARIFDPRAGAEISGALLRNNIDSAGFSTNEGQIEARFIVQAGGTVRFDKIKRIDHQWESSFAGAVAVPLAANNYALMVQKLIASLLRDPEFIDALRK